MGKWRTVLFQVGALIVQGATLLMGIVPDSKKPAVVFGVGVIQGAQALAAHYYNPDGTKATTAYQPPVK